MAVSKRVALAVSGLIAGTLATPLTAQVMAGAATGGCQATAHVDSQWGDGPAGGEIVSVTVVNTAVKRATTWTTSWTLPSGQRIVNSWSATVTTSSGTATAVNLPWNGTLAPGASTSFGMQLAGTGPAPVLSCTDDAAPPPSSPPASGTVSPPPPVPTDVKVTEADNQTTVTLVVGQTLGVSLPAEYRPIPYPSTALWLDSNLDGYPSGRPLRERFRAIATGSLDLSTQTDDPCFHTTPPCARPVKQWTVHIDIVNPPPGGPTVTVYELDNTKSVSLHVGDTLVISLSYIYPAPTLTPTGPLVPVSVTGGYPALTPLDAHYRAASPGEVDVATLSDIACNHEPLPCPSPQVWWRLHVTITG